MGWWEVTFKVMQQDWKWGNQRGQNSVSGHLNGPANSVVKILYEKIYKEKSYTELWFTEHDKKPTLLITGRPWTWFCNQQGVRPEPILIPIRFHKLKNRTLIIPHYKKIQGLIYWKNVYLDLHQRVKRIFHSSDYVVRGYYEWGGETGFCGTGIIWSFWLQFWPIEKNEGPSVLKKLLFITAQLARGKPGSCHKRTFQTTP